MQESEEIWKDIEGYEGLYQVSTNGRIKSLDKMVTCPANISLFRLLRGKFLKPQIKFGYQTVNLYSGGKMTTKTIHRLVASAFIENKEGKKCVNHIDYDRTNNCLPNLEWMTTIENNAHSYDNITKKSSETIRAYNALKLGHKPVIKMDLQGKFIREYESISQASIDVCGRVTSTISAHIHNPHIRKSAFKFKWKLKNTA